MQSQEAIERRAYELYEQRGREDGHDWDDWLQAERELATPEDADDHTIGNPQPHLRRDDAATDGKQPSQRLLDASGPDSASSKGRPEKGVVGEPASRADGM